MTISMDIICAGGTLKPQEDTRFHMTVWYIPGGWDYNNARVVSGYFSEEERVKAFVAKNHKPPEMAEYHIYNPSKENR